MSYRLLWVRCKRGVVRLLSQVGSKDALGKYVILGYLLFMINDNVYVRNVCSQWGGVYESSMSNKYSAMESLAVGYDAVVRHMSDV